MFCKYLLKYLHITLYLANSQQLLVPVTVSWKLGSVVYGGLWYNCSKYVETGINGSINHRVIN